MEEKRPIGFGNGRSVRRMSLGGGDGGEDGGYDSEPSGSEEGMVSGDGWRAVVKGDGGGAARGVRPGDTAAAGFLSGEGVDSSRWGNVSDRTEAAIWELDLSWKA
jgi:hypothetical protein